MTGVKNGVGQILKKDNPRLITISCTNHALQNACLNATKATIPNEVSIKTILYKLLIQLLNENFSKLHLFKLQSCFFIFIYDILLYFNMLY